MITLYSKPDCFPCRKTKLEMSLRGVDFTEIDVTTNDAALDHITKTLGHLQAPVVEIAGVDSWSGLVVAKINEHFGPKPRKATQ